MNARGQGTRERLLRATREVVRDVGYAQASVRAVQLMPLPSEVAESMQRSVGGKVLSEDEKKLFEGAARGLVETPIR